MDTLKFQKSSFLLPVWMWICLVLSGSSLTAGEAQSNFSWIKEPASQIVDGGSSVTFNCSGTYPNATEYHWKYNDERLKANENPRYSIKANGTQLEIKNADQTDEGTYQCFVTAGANKTVGESFKAVLTVKDSTFTKENSSSTDESSNITWIAHPSSQTVEEGTTVTFTCSVSCNKQIKYHWKANNKTLQKASEPRYILTPNGTLEIASAKAEDKGIYQCFVTTKDGTKTLGESFTAMLDVKDESSEKKSKEALSLWKTTAIAVGCAAGYVGVVAILMIYLERRRARKNNRAEEDSKLGRENFGLEHDIEDGTRDSPLVVAMDPMFSSQPTNDNIELEFPKLDLEELMNLGNGTYGRAFLGRANGIRDNERDSVVVVKSLHSKEDHVREQFNKEMETLCGLQHSNVVGLLGVCSRDEPFYMIFELMEKGDLKQFLLSCANNGQHKLDASKKISICHQILTGMNYLSSQNFVHKDLAARNCMISRDLTVKIGFLSLSCDLYNAEYYRYNSKHIPLRWMPPEAIFSGEFSEKSDVWSFGVLVWEIYTCGQMPFHDRTNEEVLEHIKGNLRLPRPDNCPDTVSEVLKKCWEGNSLARPTFQHLMNTSLL